MPEKSLNTESKKRTLVKVVIPVYKADLSPYDMISLRQTMQVLGKREIVAVRPSGLDLSSLAAEFPQLKFEDFDPSYFKGIKGYNRLMTSPEFYSRFADAEYVLIAQLDTYMFRDELDEWCSRGYDYVGAPWLQRPINKFWPVKWLKKRSDSKRIKKGLYSRIALYGRVGNGGLSLRRVDSHLAAVERHKEQLAQLNQIGKKGQPEDVFFAMLDGEFRYPTAQEALRFSFDKYPRYSYRLTGHQLPMGCHAWHSRKMKRFWQPIISF